MFHAGRPGTSRRASEPRAVPGPAGFRTPLPPRHLPAAAPAPPSGAGPTSCAPNPALLARHQDPIVAVATPGRGAVGIVRVRRGPPLIEAAAAAAGAARGHVRPFLAADGSTIDQRPGDPLPAPHSYTGEGGARTAGAWRAGAAAAAAGALPEAMPACAWPGRANSPSAPSERQARPRAGRGRGRPDRRQHRAGRALGRPLAGGAFSHRSTCCWRRAPCNCARWSRPRSDFPGRRSTSSGRPTRGPPSSHPASDAVLDRERNGRCCAKACRGAGRPANVGKELAAQRAGRCRAGDRHAGPRHHARPVSGRSRSTACRCT